MSDYLAVTHDVFNQPRALENYNLYGGDRALTEGVEREGAGWAGNDLSAFGASAGTAEMLELGHLANKFPPEFDSHDRFGHRVDLVRFHPAYHQLMERAIGEGLHSSPWTEPRTGAHVARAARFYMQSQIEAGHGCPITMTFASVAALRRQPDLAQTWLPKITARSYDPRNIPAAEKSGLTVGMAMTEKQGGSDVRANTTRALPQADGTYALVGHKYFVSAPMCDLFLVLAQAPGGLTCFLLPRWRPDGGKNPLQIQRLKNKMGNKSNASSETELRGALAWRVGEEGRGVATILEMVALTRFDCMIGSSAGMRMAASQALFHCSQRSVFGKLLTEQPLMQNVLADLSLESEAALALTLRLARALDRGEESLLRIATAIGKYWICKRTPNHAYEAMESIGGSGVMEDGPMPRLFRESPVNAIWEGSGNVQCLDVLRAMGRNPEAVEALFAEFESVQGAHAALDRHAESLRRDLSDPADAEFRARDLVDRMAIGLQAAILVKTAPSFVAEPFIASRIEGQGQHHYGALPRGTDCRSIIQRGMPA